MFCTVVPQGTDHLPLLHFLDQVVPSSVPVLHQVRAAGCQPFLSLSLSLSALTTTWMCLVTAITHNFYHAVCPHTECIYVHVVNSARFAPFYISPLFDLPMLLSRSIIAPSVHTQKTDRPNIVSLAVLSLRDNVVLVVAV